jgi:choline dehydrogenase-like flavoprotein
LSSYARKPERVNVCIVGSGSTGGTVAKVLTEAGLSVVGIERGPWLQPKDFSMDEIKYLGREYLHPDPRLKPRTRRADENSKAEVFPFSPLPQLVGGGSVHWNAWTPRPKSSDFRQLSIHGPVEGASLADWPISYEDLEPYLTKVEWELGVSGLARPSPHEAPRSGPYPCPPPPSRRSDENSTKQPLGWESTQDPYHKGWSPDPTMGAPPLKQPGSGTCTATPHLENQQH